MNKQIITVVDAPEVSLSEDEKAGDALLKFYHALGWNGGDTLDLCKIRTTKEVIKHLYEIMCGKNPDPIFIMRVCTTLVNIGPSVDDYVPPGKVYLYEDWIIPAEPKEPPCANTR